MEVNYDNIQMPRLNLVKKRQVYWISKNFLYKHQNHKTWLITPTFICRQNDWNVPLVRNIKINYTVRTKQCKSYYKKASEIQHHLLIRDQRSCIHPWLHHFPNGKDSTASYSVQAVCKFFFHLSSWSKLWKHWWICLSKTKDSVKGFRRCTQLPRLFSSTSIPKKAIMKTLASLLKT